MKKTEPVSHPQQSGSEDSHTPSPQPQRLASDDLPTESHSERLASSQVLPRTTTTSLSPEQPGSSKEDPSTSTTTTSHSKELEQPQLPISNNGDPPPPTGAARVHLPRMGHLQQQPPADLGDDDIVEPAQVRLKQFPKKQQHTNDCKRSFSANWYNQRDWLEYSVKADAAFCFPCRKFGGNDSVFTTVGYTNWKHANDKSKGFSRHSNSKEHQECVALWKELELRRKTGKEVSTMINSDQLARHRFYVSAIIDVLEFLVSNELPLRGDIDSVNSGGEAGSGLFLSLFNYTLRQNQELAKVFCTIPKNATYTSHDIQNHIIELMSTMVKEYIVKDVGDSWFTIKVEELKVRQALKMARLLYAM